MEESLDAARQTRRTRNIEPHRPSAEVAQAWLAGDYGAVERALQLPPWECCTNVLPA
jgi:hypothetical protein